MNASTAEIIQALLFFTCAFSFYALMYWRSERFRCATRQFLQWWNERVEASSHKPRPKAPNSEQSQVVTERAREAMRNVIRDILTEEIQHARRVHETTR